MSYDDINFVHDLSIPTETAEDIERAKHVLLYISTRTGKGKGCWASQGRMAEEMAMPLRAVERAISFLKRRAIITVTRRSHRSNIIKMNTQPSADAREPPTVGGSPGPPQPPSVGGAVASSDPSAGGGSQMTVKPPTGPSQTAALVADKQNERAGRSVRALAAPLRKGRARARPRSGIAEQENELTKPANSAMQSGSDREVSAAESVSPGRSASLTRSDSRAADLPIDGELITGTEVPAVISAALAEAGRRSPNAMSAGFDRPIITTEQVRENEADARLNADLLQAGLLESAIDWINDSWRAKAIAAEIAERGAGLNLVRSEMLKTTSQLASGSSPGGKQLYKRSNRS